MKPEKQDTYLAFAWFICVMLFIVACLIAMAKEANAQEKYMATDVGYVVLTDEPCHITWEKPGNGLEWHAYATDVQAKEPHIGCWKMADPMTVQVFWPEVDYSGIYKATLFKDEKESF